MTPSPLQSSSPSRDSQAKRRRLEAEMLMYQSDRGRFLRKKEELDVEKRTLEHALLAKEAELVLKEDEVRKVALDIQGVDNELLRLKREMNRLG